MARYQMFSLTSLALLGTFSVPVHAQTVANIYAIMDAGVRYSDGLAVSSTSSVSGSSRTTTAMVSGSDRSGRLGLNGLEELGGGYQALFVLESDLYLNSGSVNVNVGTDKNSAGASANKLFERQSYLGLATPVGKFLFGRQQSTLRDVIDDIDAVNGRFTSFNPNLQYTALNSSGLVSSASTYFGTGDAGNGSMMRQDNMTKFIRSAGPVTMTVAESFGSQSGSLLSGSSTELAFTYSDGSWLLAAALVDLHNTVNTTQNPATDPLKLMAFTMGGRFTSGNWQFAANYGGNRADNTPVSHINTDIGSLGTTYAITPALDLTIGYYRVLRSWSTKIKPDADIHRVLGFVEYKLSKNTLIYTEFDWNRWGGDPTQFQGGSLNRERSTGVTLGLNRKI